MSAHVLDLDIVISEGNFKGIYDKRENVPFQVVQFAPVNIITISRRQDNPGPSREELSLGSFDKPHGHSYNC